MQVKDEGNLPSEGGVSDLDLTGSACSIMGQTDTLLSVFIRDLKLAVTKALASKEGAAGNAGAQQRWLNFAKFLEAGSDDEDEATEETINPSQGEAGETEQGESATGPLGSQTVVTESEGEMVQGQESGGNSEGNFRGPALSSEEALQLTEQATVHISSLASLCLFPVALRKTLQALRPLLKAAYPASAVGWAAYALGSTFAAWNRLEPSVVGEALYDRPWFAAFLPPRRGELLCPSWRESGVFELFELLETWAGSAEKWTAVCAQDRRELVIAVQAFASVAPTFCVDASELSAAKGLAPVSSGLAAALRVVLGGEAHPTEREIFLEASILLAHKYPRLFYGGFSGAWLEDLVSPSERLIRGRLRALQVFFRGMSASSSDS